MFVSSLALRGFRCFDRLDLDFDPHITFIKGPNGSGKTSILEALHVASYMRSFRTPAIDELIAQNTPAFSLKVQIEHVNGNDLIQLGYGEGIKKAEINGIGPATRRQLFTLLPLVATTEEDMKLIQGLPEGRRLFIDQIAVRLDPNYVSLLQRYERLLKQRTALLSSENCHIETYRILSSTLWELSDTIRRERNAVLEKVFSRLNTLYTMVLPMNEPIEYKYCIGKEERVFENVDAWCKGMFAREKISGRNLCGAHLDDIEIFSQAVSVRRFASRGMQKLLVVLLRCAHAELIQPALMLFDDIMADFDEKRLEAVFCVLSSFQNQMIFTVPTHETTYLTTLAQQKNAKIIKLQTKTQL